jgi:hypothetical protein
MAWFFSLTAAEAAATAHETGMSPRFCTLKELVRCCSIF